MTSDSPKPPSQDAVKELVEKLTQFVQWVAQLILNRNWFTLLLLIEALLILFCTPGGVVASFLKNSFSLELPKWYSSAFWLVVGGIFIAAIIMAIRTLPQDASKVEGDFRERKSIKGLRPFSFEDAEIFSSLQRNSSIKECLEAITIDNFRFGILLGESGCGKTSFIQAGVYPRLSADNSTHRPIYIRFTNRDPFESVCKALVEQIPLSENEIQGLDFLSLLQHSVETASQTLVLFFDQFEQFFVQYKRKEQRELFVNALSHWYRTDELPVKIIACIRADLSDRLEEFHKALGYSLGPQDVFRLEKFEPEAATKILAVIAETEQLEFDRAFVTELAQQELAGEDGLISPVNLQILAWMIERQNAAENRAFNRVAFQKLGGIEGLLTRYLEKTLDARATKAQREATVKVLLALTDLDRQVRVGALTLVDLQAKLKDSVKADEVEEVISWLSRSDVRLVTSIEETDVIKYELAHERLIPALLRLAGKELSEVDKANQLLERRVNEWLGNQCNARYLLGWRELQLIGRQKPYLMFGTKRTQKQRFIKRSKQQLYGRFGVILGILAIFIAYQAWLWTPWGQIQQVRGELVRLSLQRVEDDEYQVQAAIALAKDDHLTEALKIAEKIDNVSYKASALSAIATAIGKFNQPDKAADLLAQTLKSAEKIDDSFRKASALSAIAAAIEKFNQPDKAADLLAQALKSVEKIDDSRYKNSALRAIVAAIGKFNQPDKASDLLTQTLKSAEKIDDPFLKASALSAIAAAYGKLNQPQKAAELLANAFKSAETLNYLFLKANALRDIVEALENLNQPDKAVDLLIQALKSAETLNHSFLKASALRAIAAAIEKLNQSQKAVELLEQSLKISQTLYDSCDKASALRAIAAVYGKLNQPQKAVELMEQSLKIPQMFYVSCDKTSVLRAIAVAIGKFNQPDKAADLLAQTLKSAEKIDDSFRKASALSAIAAAIEKFNQPDKAANLLAQALKSVEKIDDSRYRNSALRAIVAAIGKFNQPDKASDLLAQALKSAETLNDSFRKASALSAIAAAYGKLNQPDKAAELLAQALKSAETLNGSFLKADALRDIAEAQAKLGYWRQARQNAEKIPLEDQKIESLAQILTIWAEKHKPAWVEEEESE